MKSIYTILFLTLQIFTYGQEQINKFDSNGKKHGEWIVYLDNKWKKTNDTIKAKYIAFDKYIDGISYCSLIGKLKMPMYHESINSQKVLNGEHKWFDKSKRLKAVYYFSNGRIDSIKHYRKNGELEFSYDFLTTYDNDPFTFLLYWYYPKTAQSILYMKRKNIQGQYILQTTDSKDPHIIWKQSTNS